MDKKEITKLNELLADCSKLAMEIDKGFSKEGFSILKRLVIVNYNKS